MSNLDVALRLRLERSGFEEGKRDLEELRRLQAQLGRGPAGRGGGRSPLSETADEAKRAREELERLGRAGGDNRAASGLEALSREATRLDRNLDAAARRARELRASADNLQNAEGAAVLQRQIAAIGRAGERARDDLQSLGRAAAQIDGQGADQLRQALDRIGTRAGEVDSAIDEVRRSVGRLGREDGADHVARDLRQAADAAEQLERRARAAGRAVSTMQVPGGGDTRLRSFGREAWQESGGARFVPIGAGMGMAGIAGVGAGMAAYGVGAAGVGSARRAMATESSMADVERALNNPTPEQLRSIETGVAQLSRRDGIAASDYYSFITEAAKSGTAFEDLLGFSQFGQRFALAADMTGAEAGETLAKIRNNYGLSLEGLRDNADTINYLADSDAAKERNIVEFMRRASGNARVASLSADQVATYGSVFDSLGVSSEVGGTAMNAVIQRLGTARNTARTDEGFRRSLGRLGLSGAQLQSDFFEDGNATIIDLLGRVGQLPRERQLETLQGLGGAEYGDDLALLVGALERLVETQERLTDPGRAGSVDRTFEIFDKQTAQDLRRAAAAISDLGNELGKELLPAIRALAQMVASIAGRWADGIRRSRATDEMVDRVHQGGAITPADEAAIAAGEVSGDLVREAEDTRRGRLAEEADRDLRMTDDEDERRAGERARTERTRDQIQREIDENRALLDVLGPSQAGHADTVRKLEVLEERLLDINETLRQMGAGGVSPIGFGSVGGGEARLHYASLGSAGPGRPSGGRGSGGGGGYVPSASAAVGAGGPGLRTSRNPGGAAGELFDVWSADFSDAQALALLGHAEKESSFNPQAWNAGEGAGGILQWRGNRLDNLKRFAAEKGMDWQDRSVQAAFVAHEMRTDPYERGKSERFRNATTLEEASAGLEDYIRFGDGSGAERLANARRHAGAFGAGGPGGAADPMGILSYRNNGATRNRPITPELFSEIERGVSAVYGEGYRAEVYSGGQDARGTGSRRTGSTRHDDRGRGGMAADVYVYDPEGNRLTGEDLGRLGQHWLANDLGGVGMEMRGGGIHLDQHTDRHPAWSYGGYRPGQAKQVQDGLAGIPPAYANPSALDAAAMAEGAAPDRLPRGGGMPTPTARPAAEAQERRGGGTRTAPGVPVNVTQNFRGGFDARAVAARAQREQNRSIRMAEARSLHDTMVPIS